ncbi:hypothetical protein WR25_14299 [Diploscapter pachys]|uniref:SSD domain-containing protein n=1 Tax=Diploscapter pachys TaxID=2018661 RepID=A0A2A2KH49_9BILA|nr:hypothetical protein WR25_14299 [Diploscapter pachys]
MTFSILNLTSRLRVPGASGFLHKWFYRIGLVIAYHILACIIVTLLVSCFSLGLVHLKFAQRLQDGFVSARSSARYEERIKADFDGTSSFGEQKFVALVRRKDRGSLLSKNQINQVIEIEKYLKNLKIRTDGIEFSHADICGTPRMCLSNALLEGFQKAVEGVYNNSDVFIDHPKTMFMGYSFLIAHHIFGIERKIDRPVKHPNDALGETIIIPYNSKDTWPVESNRTNLRSIEMIALYFQAPITNTNTTNLISVWEKAIFEWSQVQTNFPDFEINIMGDKILGMEMVRSGLSLIPYLIAGAILTVIFVKVVCFWNALSVGRINPGLGLIIIGMLAAPILAVSTTFGLMGILGVELFPGHMVIPFLVLAIGVDNAFLMQTSWDRQPKEKILRGKEALKSLAVRFAKVLEEIGPSILITSLTNALAFTIGTMLSVPAMQSFCLSAASAIALAFIFQLTLFGSLLVISGFFESCHSMIEKPVSVRTQFFATFLSRRSTRLVVVLATVILFLSSLFGTLRMVIRVDSQRIIPSDSALKITDKLFSQYYWKEYEPLFLFVNNPPDISKGDNLDQLQEMVRDFENLPRALGTNSTMFWFNDYQSMMKHAYYFYNAIGGDYKLSYDELPTFLKHAQIWDSFIKWHKEGRQVIVDQYYFIIGFHNATTWEERAENMKNWRQLAQKWSKFNVTGYSETSAVFEGIHSLGGQTALAAGLTLACMVVICIFLVPSLVGVIVASCAIASISLGVVGYLSLCGFDLDPVTMSAVVMSIGCSVDYTAHVTYHFQRAWKILGPKATSQDCVVYTFDAVGLSMLEAAFSTLVCFIPVAIHPDYVPKVFFFTILFVVFLGLIYGLIILPTFLAMLPREFFVNDRKSRSSILGHSLPGVIEPQKEDRCGTGPTSAHKLGSNQQLAEARLLEEKLEDGRSGLSVDVSQLTTTDTSTSLVTDNSEDNS